MSSGIPIDVCVSCDHPLKVDIDANNGACDSLLFDHMAQISFLLVILSVHKLMTGFALLRVISDLQKLKFSQASVFS